MRRAALIVLNVVRGATPNLSVLSRFPLQQGEKSSSWMKRGVPAAAATFARCPHASWKLFLCPESVLNYSGFDWKWLSLFGVSMISLLNWCPWNDATDLLWWPWVCFPPSESCPVYFVMSSSPVKALTFCIQTRCTISNCEHYSFLNRLTTPRSFERVGESAESGLADPSIWLVSSQPQLSWPKLDLGGGMWLHNALKKIQPLDKAVLCWLCWTG